MNGEDTAALSMGEFFKLVDIVPAYLRILSPRDKDFSYIECLPLPRVLFESCFALSYRQCANIVGVGAMGVRILPFTTAIAASLAYQSYHHYFVIISTCK